MKRIYLFLTVIIFLSVASSLIKAQDSIATPQAQDESKLKISGELLSDERLLLKDKNNWVWNENRLTLKFDKKITDNSKFQNQMKNLLIKILVCPI